LGALGALLATNQPAALKDFIEQRTGVAVPSVSTNDPVEKEFQKLLELDDAAQEEADKWIEENDKFAAKGAGVPKSQLRDRILKRVEPVEKAYADFIKDHPKHSRARVAYASFLGDIKGEEAAEAELEKALAIDTNNPAIYNNLANIYGHIGPVTNAFAYYEKALQISPNEPVYYHNFGTTVYLFRTDAKEYYHINEDQVFNKAFGLYSNAMRLDPDNFVLASDVAQTYYGVKPLRTNDALVAWTNAFKLASNEAEREGVQIHFARVKYLVGRYDEARAHLNLVTNENYLDLRNRLLKRIAEHDPNASDTNAGPAQSAAPQTGAAASRSSGGP